LEQDKDEVNKREVCECEGEFIKTVFASGSPMMRTFDKKNLGKRPPPFPHTPQKNLGRRVCVDRAEHTFCGANRDFFFLKFQEHEPEGCDHKFMRKKYFNPQTFLL
jgi:hypothetical protein